MCVFKGIWMKAYAEHFSFIDIGNKHQILNKEEKPYVNWVRTAK